LRWLLIAGGYHKDHQSAESSMYGIVKDITERKCLDQQLHQKNADLEIAKYLAEEASLAKSEFLSRMSHELRTPLNAILGYAQLLEVGTPPLTETQHKRIKPIINAGWYLLELINEILDLDAIESGNLGLLPESLSLQDILLECQSLVQTQAEQEDIQLNFIQCDSSWTIYADKTRIKQLLLNLLSNAIKYNREHGSVTVQCIQTSEYLHICIKDNGEGLTAEQLAELFKPFNRLGQELSDKQGTGIGLVVTKALVEKMGGTISVESTVGVGSEFCVNLLRNDRRIKLRTKAKHGRLE
jgi:signal transduction histidine kinase